MYLYFILIDLSVSKNRAVVSTTASLISPSRKWDVEDIDRLNSKKIIKRKLDFGSTPQIDADIHHNNINIDHSSIHYSKIIYFDIYKIYYYTLTIHIII